MKTTVVIIKRTTTILTGKPSYEIAFKAPVLVCRQLLNILNSMPASLPPWRLVIILNVSPHHSNSQLLYQRPCLSFGLSVASVGDDIKVAVRSRRYVNKGFPSARSVSYSSDNLRLYFLGMGSDSGFYEGLGF
jgi:hypothetical protein